MRTEFCCTYIWRSVPDMGYTCNPQDCRARQMLPYCSHRSRWCLPYFIRRTSTMRPALPRSRSSTWCVSSQSLLEKPGPIDHMNALDKWLIRSRLRISLTVLIPHTIFVFSHCCHRQLLLMEQPNVKERTIKPNDVISDTNRERNCWGETTISVNSLGLREF